MDPDLLGDAYVKRHVLVVWEKVHAVVVETGGAYWPPVLQDFAVAVEGYTAVLLVVRCWCVLLRRRERAD